MAGQERILLFCCHPVQIESGYFSCIASRCLRPGVLLLALGLVIVFHAGCGRGKSALSASERAWEEISKTMEPPPLPKEWETQKPAPAEMESFRQRQAAHAMETAGRMASFYEKHPKSERAAEAREMERRLLNLAVQLGHTNARARVVALEESRLKDPKLSVPERIQIRIDQLHRLVSAHAETNLALALAEFELGVRRLQSEFPQERDLTGILLSVAEEWGDYGDAAKAIKLAREVLQAKPDGDVEATATKLLRKFERVGKPLAIRFKAIDGRDVDLAAMKGKVVLVDFWATWCRPCMKELPAVRAAYDKLHAKGFEIVGISLDRERGALEKGVAQEKLAWPQYFDGGGEKSFAEMFDIRAIPVMWLVDKQGNLRDLNAGQDLVAKVERLLAE